MLDLTMILDIIRGTTYAMTPLILAAVGEIFNERAGIVNIGLEGIMLISGFMSVVAAEMTLNPIIGVLAGVAIGAFIGLIHGYITAYLKGDHIISGLGINLFALGAVAFGIEAVWGVRGYHTPPDAAKVPDIPVLEISPIFIAMILITIGTHYLLYRTSVGLKVRAVGENPEAADVVGVNVERVQLLATIYGAALTGLAGAFLSIDWLTAITKELPAGRGFIALALVNFANWSPLLALGGGLLFGFFWTLGEWIKNMAAIKAVIPVTLMNTIPYIATLAVVAGLIGKSRPPRYVGRPYKRE